MRPLPLRLLIPCAALLSACGADPTPSTPVAAPSSAPAAGAGIDWSRCQLDGATLPVRGKLLVVDGGLRTPEYEAGRESIRRVEVLVPGPVALLLTAPDATVWLVRASPETQITGLFAAGDQAQRISGQNVDGPQRAASGVLGEACGRYWLQDGAGPQLAQVSQEIFGRPHDAIYTMRIGTVVIGGADSTLPEGVDPGR
jgi:hypothetical protein